MAANDLPLNPKYCMSEHHREILRGHMTFFKDTIAVISGIKDHLVESRALTDQMCDIIEIQPIHSAKVEKMIIFLLTRPDKAFYDLITALDKCGDEHVAQKLRDADADPKYHRKDDCVYEAATKYETTMDLFLQNFVAPAMGADSEKIGINLGLTYNEVQGIKLSTPYNYGAMNLAILMHWKVKALRHPKPMESLLNAMKESGRFDIWRKLEELLSQDKWNILLTK